MVDDQIKACGPLSILDLSADGTSSQKNRDRLLHLLTNLNKRKKKRDSANEENRILKKKK